MDVTLISIVTVILICITAYFIMTKDSRLKERELKMLEAEKELERRLKEKELKLKEEAQDYEYELKLKALEHEQKLKEDEIDRVKGCKHNYALFHELVGKNERGGITSFTNVYKCTVCGKMKEESINV